MSISKSKPWKAESSAESNLAMTLKDYYENFKDELSDSDFSDCEFVEAYQVKTDIFIEALHQPIVLVKSLATIKVEEAEKENLCESVQTRSVKAKCGTIKTNHQTLQKRTSLRLQNCYKCDRCNKTFIKETFLNQHTPFQCSQHQIVTSRRRNAKSSSV